MCLSPKKNQSPVFPLTKYRVRRKVSVGSIRVVLGWRVTFPRVFRHMRRKREKFSRSAEQLFGERTAVWGVARVCLSSHSALTGRWSSSRGWTVRRWREPGTEGCFEGSILLCCIASVLGFAPRARVSLVRRASALSESDCESRWLSGGPRAVAKTLYPRSSGSGAPFAARRTLQPQGELPG